MGRQIRFCLALGCVMLLQTQLHAETRFHQYTKKYKNPNNPARPLAAGYFGGSGDEYLSGGAFLEDGSLLLAGTIFGNEFSPDGVRVQVLGRDGTPPRFKMRTRTKRGRVRLMPPNWEYVDGAGFVALLDSNCRTVRKVVRFPWGSGSLTDIATDARGQIYVCGIVGPSFGNLTSAQMQRESVEGNDVIYIGQLRGDLSGFEWCLKLHDRKDHAPKMRVLDDGNISLMAANARHISPQGRIVKSTKLHITNNWVRGVDPLTHACATGGDGNTNTGWEPWRKPVLFIFNDKGEHDYCFYRWNEKLVGLNWSRLVSDSSIRCLSYDKDGNLLVAGWSDGGNSVLEYVPYDMKTSVYSFIKKRTGKSTGLGFSTWGAGVGSFCHLMKIDPKTGYPLGKTLFIAYLASKNKPNGLAVKMLDSAPDNSVLLAGGSAYGLIETGSIKVNTLKIGEDYIGGDFIAVLNELMNDIRFCSAIPGGGQVDQVRHSKKKSAAFWQNSRKLGTKSRVVFVCGAKEDPKFKQVNNAQRGFGGGNLDGLYVVLEMDNLDLEYEVAGKPQDSGKKRRKKRRKKDNVSGTFQVSENARKNWSVLVMRDGSGKKWPTFYLSAPSGQGTVKTSGSGSFTIVGPGDKVALLGGDRQDKKLGGELFDKDKRAFPELKVEVTLRGAGNCSGVIHYNGKKVNVNGTYNIRPSKPTGNGINIGGVFATTKGELGLGDDYRERKEPVTVEFWAPGR